MTQKILIVDDSKVSRLFISSYFHEVQPDWQLFEADGGQQAQELVDEHHFFAITLDYNMPGLNGLELASLLRVKNPTCFMGLLTANVQRFTQDDAAKAGVKFYKKPVSLDLIKLIADDIGAFYGSV
jgi:two-component system, chemotaxis family, chemotaxis protein CheY